MTISCGFLEVIDLIELHLMHLMRVLTTFVQTTPDATVTVKRLSNKTDAFLHKSPLFLSIMLNNAMVMVIALSRE